MFFIFRFENVSRGYLFILSFLVPLMLLIMRNTEFLSSLLEGQQMKRFYQLILKRIQTLET